MNILKTITLGLLFAGVTSFTADNPPKPFMDLLDRAKLAFVNPAGLVETPSIENPQMNYEYAMKYADKKFEVRFAIRPLDEQIKDYEEKEKTKKPGETNTNPNALYASLFKMTVLNISGGDFESMADLDKQTVKTEFNADWGAMAVLPIAMKEFGQSYKFCKVLAIHKDNVGDAFIFFLSDSKDGFDDLMKPAYHSLKFK